jgi:hypothetical protein
MRLGLAVSFVFAVGALLAREAAAAGDSELAWVRGDGAETCPGSQRMRQLVAQRLGRTSLELGERELSGFVTRESSGTWSARVFLRDKSGALVGAKNLTSEAADCEPLANAVALAMALAVDPDAVSRTAAAPLPALPPDEPPPPKPEPPMVAPVAPAPPPPAPPAPTPKTGIMATSARAMLTLGLTPRPAPGFATLIRYPENRLVEAAFGFLWAPEAALKADEFGVGLTAGRAGACLRPWADGRTWVRTCGTLLAGALHAAGKLNDVAPSGDRFWMAAGLEGGAGLVVHAPFFLELTAEAVVPFVRETFLARIPPRNGFQQPVVAGVFSLGAGVAIP